MQSPATGGSYFEVMVAKSGSQEWYYPVGDEDIIITTDGLI